MIIVKEGRVWLKVENNKVAFLKLKVVSVFSVTLLENICLNLQNF